MEMKMRRKGGGFNSRRVVHHHAQWLFPEFEDAVAQKQVQMCPIVGTYLYGKSMEAFPLCGDLSASMMRHHSIYKTIHAEADQP